MKNFRILGLLGVTDEGEFIFVPMQGMSKLQIMSTVPDATSKGVDVAIPGKIVDVPSPEEEAAFQEREADLSLDGRLSAAKKREKKESV